MKNIITLLLVLFFCFSTTALSQNPEWINYTNGDYITAFEFEGDFIWVGTWGGIVQINKISGETSFYDELNSGLPENHISCIAIDASGNKWIGIQWGSELVKYDGTDWTTYNIPTLGSIICLTIDNSENKWIGTDNGLAKFDGTDWTVYYTSNSGLPYNRIRCIAIDDSGNKWIGTGGGWISKI